MINKKGFYCVILKIYCDFHTFPLLQTCRESHTFCRKFQALKFCQQKLFTFSLSALAICYTTQQFLAFLEFFRPVGNIFSFFDYLSQYCNILKLALKNNYFPSGQVGVWMGGCINSALIEFEVEVDITLSLRNYLYGQVGGWAARIGIMLTQPQLN